MVDLLTMSDNNPLTIAGRRARSGLGEAIVQTDAPCSASHVTNSDRQATASGFESGPEEERANELDPEHHKTPAAPIAVKGWSHDALTYFHLPANNMSWVEKAMSRYYGEKDLDYDPIDGDRSPETRTRAYMLLRPQFWKGQEYGGRSAIVHARHMRPICEMVSTETTTIKLDSTPKNIVLFCPYLHWDTDRYRDRIAQVIAKEEERERIHKQTTADRELQARREERQGLPLPNRKFGHEMLKHYPSHLPVSDEGPEFSKPTRSFTSIIPRVLAPYHNLKRHLQSEIFRRDPKTGRILAGDKLGQLLIDAARLYEAMSCYRDKSLIRRYLHANPPLHPRRTLDQAYYCTLKTTKRRDQDQVVYRGTRANPLHLHHIDPETKRWTCPGRQDIAEAAEAARNVKHGKRSISKEDQMAAELAYKCPECTDHIRKVARLVMVDQLWMWILDEKTLITCFPRRYGVNRKDPSGVHHIVRKHLKNIRKEHIRTVFDLALIVLVEVTNIFFDRAKTPDHQPQVIDIFADAIGEITNKQAVAFEHLWAWTSKVVNLVSPNPFSDITALVFPLLNINPEGQFQGEIKDILDELDIMLLINRQQLEVIKKFVKNAEDILDPKGDWRGLKGSSFELTDSDCEETGSEARELAKKKKDYRWFKTQATELLSSIENHINELKALRDSAESTSSSLENLLGLMQQQASALQAWQSVRQAEETVKQGRAIMMFTTVTIIFLPLSFMTGVFGMNNSDFTSTNIGNTMTFGQQLQYMLPISVSIIVVALILAYAARSKPIAAVFWRFFVSWIFIESGFFNLWLTLTWQRDKWVRTTDKWVKKMKEEVLKKRQQRMEMHLVREQAMMDAKDKKKAGAGDGVGTASGSVGRESSIFDRLSRGGSRGSARSGVHTMSSAGGGSTNRPTVTGANGHVNRESSIRTSKAPTGEARPPTGVGTGSATGQSGPRGSALSGLTTLAPSSTTPGTDPSSVPAATMGGGGGGGEGRVSSFLDWPLEDIV